MKPLIIAEKDDLVEITLKGPTGQRQIVTQTRNYLTESVDTGIQTIHDAYHNKNPRITLSRIRKLYRNDGNNAIKIPYVLETIELVEPWNDGLNIPQSLFRRLRRELAKRNDTIGPEPDGTFYCMETYKRKLLINPQIALVQYPVDLENKGAIILPVGVHFMSGTPRLFGNLVFDDSDLGSVYTDGRLVKPPQSTKKTELATGPESPIEDTPYLESTGVILPKPRERPQLRVLKGGRA